MQWLLSGLLFLTLNLSLAAQLPWRYDLADPRQSWELPDSLNEISGLGWDSGGQHLLAVQDELGLVFPVDPEDGRPGRSVPFWKDADYEGIEAVGDEVFVVKKTGTLYAITGLGTEAQAVTKYNGFLTDDYDVEGLAYDAGEHRLLLASKAEPGGAPLRAIFAFDLATRAFVREPVALLRRAAFDTLLATYPTELHSKFYERFGPEERELDFYPSALAIHPVTGHYYVASGKGRMLVVMTPGGRLLWLYRLDKDLLRQLEGICFAPDGTLYLASERKGDDPAVIHVFSPPEEAE